MTPQEIEDTGNDPSATKEEIERAAEALAILGLDDPGGAFQVWENIRNSGQSRIEAAWLRRQAALGNSPWGE